MAFDLQEQEQIDAMKAFWQQWGRWIAAGVLGLSLGYLGYKGWGLYQERVAAQASVVYAQLEDAAGAGDVAKVKPLAAALQNDYARTGYATRGALLLAKLAFDKGDAATAETQLKWVIAQGNDEAVQAVARLRLAAVLLDGKKYDAALAELNQAHPAEFDSFFADARGDVLVAKGDSAAARDAYKAALAKISAEQPMRDFVQAKLDALGN